MDKEKNLKGLRSVVQTELTEKNSVWVARITAKFSFSTDLVEWHDIEAMAEETAKSADEAYNKALESFLNTEFPDVGETSLVL